MYVCASILPVNGFNGKLKEIKNEMKKKIVYGTRNAKYSVSSDFKHSFHMFKHTNTLTYAKH